MINFDKFGNNSVESFGVIKDEDYYDGRLCIVRISKQDKKFVEDGKEPRDLISFVFDVVNKEGVHCHIPTKASSPTFGDQSNLPKLFAKVAKLTSGKDLSKFLYDNGGLGSVYRVSVEVTEKDGQIFNRIDKISGPSDAKIDASPINEWDLKIYGTPCEEYDLAEGYAVKESKNTKDTKSNINDFT